MRGMPPQAGLVYTNVLHDVMRIDWDEGNWPKCGTHGVSKAEIEAVLANNPSIVEDPEHSKTEERFRAVGIAPEGRHVFIVFTRRWKADEVLYRPISARYMHRDEVEFYEKAGS